MNRVPVAFPQSHTESSSISYPYFTSLSLITSSFIIITVTLYLSFYLHHSIFCCCYPLCLTIPLSLVPLLLFSFAGSSAEDAHSHSLWKEHHTLHRLECGGKQRHWESKTRWSDLEAIGFGDVSAEPHSHTAVIIRYITHTEEDNIYSFYAQMY